MGVPLDTRAIKTAQETNVFDEVIVNSDDDEILSLASEQGQRWLSGPLKWGLIVPK